MGFKIAVSIDAQNDIENAIDWYEFKQENLSSRFYDDFISTLDYLVQHPYMFPLKGTAFREATFSTFPFIIIYEILDDIIIINAIFNTSKNPVKKPKKL